MKELKIYSVDETPKPILLRLAYTGRGDVMLIAVNNEGNQLTGGRLLTLGASGPVYLHKKVDKALELPLDDKGRLKLKDYEEEAPVTFSDEEMRSIFDMRDRIRKDLRMAIVLQDHDDLSTYLCVLEKMIEALQLIDTPRARGELNN